MFYIGKDLFGNAYATWFGATSVVKIEDEIIEHDGQTFISFDKCGQHQLKMEF